MEEEPAALRATSPEVVRQQLAEHYPGMEGDALVRPYREDPQAACAAIADAYQAYWGGALAMCGRRCDGWWRTKSWSGRGRSRPRASP
uniref:Uncharacterized protein n=1 Tax=Streptomyces sp. NBC_00003 TaxID=2903608 RepID=A0AAU2V6S6_9ACTN